MTYSAKLAAKLFSSTLAMTVALSTPVVHAQEATVQKVADKDANPETGLRDIIVTAQKRAENIQSVPVAVSALDALAIEKTFAADIREFAGRVPSLVIDGVSAGPSAAAIAIRGISFEDIEKSFEPAIGVTVDGVAIGTNTGQLLDTFDLERFEVLRGPQGTLFGRNTIGGVISVTRTKPTGEFGAKASLGYASYATIRGRAVVNTPKFADVVALKGAFYYDDTGGFYRNVTQGNRRDGKYRTTSGSLTALVTPTDTITATVTYDHSQERGEVVSVQRSETGRDVICLAIPTPGGIVRPFAPAVECNRRLTLPDGGLYQSFSNIPTPVRNNTNAITGNVDVKLGDFTLTSVTGWRKNKEDVTQDFDASQINFFDTRRRQTYQQFSEELRIAGDITDSFNVVAGAYYSSSSYQLLQNTNFGPGLLAPTALGLQQNVDHKSKSYAGFADVKFKASDKLTFHLGGRYTKDKKQIFNNYGQVGALVRLSVPNWAGECVSVVGLLAPGVPRYGAGTNCNAKASFGKFTWRGSADYEIGDNKLLYASYSTGFRSGGFNGRAASPTSLGPYNPENVTAYEIGLKADWLERRLRTNIAVYQTDYKNKQEETVQPTPPGSANAQETVVANAASARIKGFELELSAQPVDPLTFRMSFAYIDAKYRNFFRDVNADLIPDNVSTLTLRRAPKYSWSTGADYTRAVGDGQLDLSTTFRYISKYQTCIVANQPAVLGAVTNDNRCLTDPRTDLSASMSYTQPIGAAELKFSVYGRNLLNDRGINSTLPVAGLFTFSASRPPRIIGAEVQAKF
jgi:iron complex outermembrane recepter protein